MLPKEIANFPIPVCRSSQVGKQIRQSVSKDSGGLFLKKNKVTPSDLVYSD